VIVGNAISFRSCRLCWRYGRAVEGLLRGKVSWILAGLQCMSSVRHVSQVYAMAILAVFLSGESRCKACPRYYNLLCLRSRIGTVLQQRVSLTSLHVHPSCLRCLAAPLTNSQVSKQKSTRPKLIRGVRRWRKTSCALLHSHNQ
jgi:hypothetical protein